MRVFGGIPGACALVFSLLFLAAWPRTTLADEPPPVCASELLNAYRGGEIGTLLALEDDITRCSNRIEKSDCSRISGIYRREGSTARRLSKKQIDECHWEEITRWGDFVRKGVRYHGCRKETHQLGILRHLAELHKAAGAGANDALEDIEAKALRDGDPQLEKLYSDLNETVKRWTKTRTRLHHIGRSITRVVRKPDCPPNKRRFKRKLRKIKIKSPDKIRRKRLKPVITPGGHRWRGTCGAGGSLTVRARNATSTLTLVAGGNAPVRVPGTNTCSVSGQLYHSGGGCPYAGGTGTFTYETGSSGTSCPFAEADNATLTGIFGAGGTGKSTCPGLDGGPYSLQLTSRPEGSASGFGGCVFSAGDRATLSETDEGYKELAEIGLQEVLDPFSLDDEFTPRVSTSHDLKGDRREVCDNRDNDADGFIDEGGVCGGPGSGDFDGNGVVDTIDYTIWRRNSPRLTLESGPVLRNTRDVEFGRNATNTDSYQDIDNDLALWRTAITGELPFNGFRIYGGLTHEKGTDRDTPGNIVRNGFIFDGTGVNAAGTPITAINNLVTRQEVESFSGRVGARFDVTEHFRGLGLSARELQIIASTGLYMESRDQKHDYTMQVSGGGPFFPYTNAIRTDAFFIGPELALDLRKRLGEHWSLKGRFMINPGHWSSDLKYTQGGTALPTGVVRKSSDHLSFRGGLGAGLLYHVNRAVTVGLTGNVLYESDAPYWRYPTAGGTTFDDDTYSTIDQSIYLGVEVSTDGLKNLSEAEDD